MNNRVTKKYFTASDFIHKAKKIARNTLKKTQLYYRHYLIYLRMHHLKKLFFISCMGLVAVVVLSGCNQTQTPSITPEANQETPQELQPKNPEQSGEWKTITVKGDGGFSFEYPSEWITSSENTIESPDWEHLISGAEFFFAVEPEGMGIGFEYLNVDAGSTKTQIGDTTVAMDQLRNEAGDIEARIYDFERNGHKYWFKFENSRKDASELTDYYNIEEHILTSFKFQEESSTKASLPAGVEWLTYEDKDLSFVYPKTFLKTPLQEDTDKNQRGESWEVSREDHTIYLRPNFESPAAESGSTYEINVFKTTEEADKFTQAIIWDEGSSKNLCSTVSDIKIDNYTVCKYERDIDKGMGNVGRYYAVIPTQKNDQSKWIYIFDGAEDMYSNYIKTILIPSLKIQEETL